MQLARLEDYVTLTDRNSQTNYIVERDGEIWKSGEFPEAYFVPNRRHNIVLNWHEHISGAVTWKWRNGYLPILEITDGKNMLEFAALGDDLLLRKNRDKVFRVPEMKEISSERFEKLLESLDTDWNDFFDAGWKPSKDRIFPDEAWRACMVQALNAFCGRHTKYGSGYYSRNYHDCFPPTIISTVDMLLDYQHAELALELLEYFLNRFILPDGSIDYYGPAISEYGMILDLVGKIYQTSSGAEWLKDHIEVFQRIARYLYRLRNRFIYGTENKYRLLAGVPEADTRDANAIYTQNNAWVWRGLNTWSRIADKLGFLEAATEASREADDIRNMLALAIQDNLMSEGLPAFRLDYLTGIKSYTESRDTVYANFRYYPELLASGFLSRELALKIIESRENRHGELAGLTYFHFAAAWSGLGTAEFCCNNLQIAAYGDSLIQLGEYERFMKVLTAHFLYHQSPDTFTAYEAVDADVSGIRRAFTDWCVPCQLAYPRMLRWGYEKFGRVEVME